MRIVRAAIEYMQRRGASPDVVCDHIYAFAKNLKNRFMLRGLK